MQIIEYYETYFKDMQPRARAALDRIDISKLTVANLSTTEVKIFYPGAGVAPGLLPLIEKLNPLIPDKAKIIVYLCDTDGNALNHAIHFFKQEEDIQYLNNRVIQLITLDTDIANPTLTEYGPFDIVFLEHPTVSNSLRFFSSTSGYSEMLLCLPNALQDNARIIAFTYTHEELKNLERLLKKGFFLEGKKQDSLSNPFFTLHRHILLRGYNIAWTAKSTPKKISYPTLLKQFRGETLADVLTGFTNLAFYSQTEWFANSRTAFTRAALLFFLVISSVTSPNNLSTRGCLIRLATIALGTIIFMTNYINLTSREAENPFELPTCPASFSP